MSPLIRPWRHPFAPESLMGQCARGLLEPEEVIAIVRAKLGPAPHGGGPHEHHPPAPPKRWNMRQTVPYQRGARKDS